MTLLPINFSGHLGFNPLLFLNPDYPILGAALFHETRHLKNGIEALDPYKDESQQAKYNRARHRLDTERLPEEMRGFAAHAQVYLLHASHTRDLQSPVDNPLRRSIHRDTAAFILTGQNPLSPRWKSYVNWLLKR